MALKTVTLGKLEYLKADLLNTPHAFSTRYGGVSQGSLSSLNLGIHRGDLRENVLKNYEILGSALGFSPEDTVFTHQTHTDIVEKVGKKDRGDGLFREVEPERDGLITNEPGVVLTVFSADCTPILFFDPVKKAVGAAHAGWRGTALGIAKKTVEAMTREFGCSPSHIRAAIGPCIGKCCFETDGDVPSAMVAALGEEANAFITKSGEKYHVDLKGINTLWLQKAGVEQIQVSEDCTVCQHDRFWSHRMTKGDRGSLAAVIFLKE